MRLALDSRASYFRIQKLLLEREKDSSGQLDYLRTLLQGFRGEVHGAIEDMVEGSSTTIVEEALGDDEERESAESSTSDTLALDSPNVPKISPASTRPLERHTHLIPSTSSRTHVLTTSPTISQPKLSSSQLRMAASLNSIPHLKKKLAFIDEVVNSHPVIVAREMKRFKNHAKGMGVVRDWAESFQL